MALRPRSTHHRLEYRRPGSIDPARLVSSGVVHLDVYPGAMGVAVGGPMLVFDGDCAFCTTAAHRMAARWTRPAQAVAWQRLGESRLDDLGLTTDEARTAAFWVDERGRLFRGHRAVAKALMAGSPAQRILGAALLTPPLSWLARPGYWVVARYRHRLPGATDACRL